MNFRLFWTYIIGRWRIYWGQCPVCNSDAPEIDTCSFCQGWHGYRDNAARERLKWRWDTRIEREAQKEAKP